MASKKLKVHGAKHCKTSIGMCTYCRPTIQKISVALLLAADSLICDKKMNVAVMMQRE